jgi:hypothetical protein
MVVRHREREMRICGSPPGRVRCVFGEEEESKEDPFSISFLFLSKDAKKCGHVSLGRAI